MSTVDCIIDAAKSYLGTVEGSDAHREIIDLYNKGRRSEAYVMTMNDPWCAAFVVAMFTKCGAERLIPGYASCQQMVNTFKQWNRWHDRGAYSPKVGDIIFYNWDADSISDHTGIIVKSRFNELSIIEGNKSDIVGYRNIDKNNASIMGYGSPDYDTEIQPPTNPAPISPYSELSSSDKSVVRGFPLLYEGCKGVWVKILQSLLVVWFSGDLQIDGEFGPITKKWVMDWQKYLALEVDGKVGKETWSSFFVM